jgi:hypothetical protein
MRILTKKFLKAFLNESSNKFHFVLIKVSKIFKAKTFVYKLFDLLKIKSQYVYEFSKF